MAFRLYIARGNSVGQVFIAVQPIVIVGREATCDVVLNDPGVSGRHVRLTERDGRYFVKDLQSSNGTLLNGATFAEDAELKNGDTLALGTAVLQLTALEATEITSERKKLVPSGVAVGAKTRTGESAAVVRPVPTDLVVANPPARSLLDADDEPALRTVLVRANPPASDDPKLATELMKANPPADDEAKLRTDVVIANPPATGSTARDLPPVPDLEGAERPTGHIEAPERPTVVVQTLPVAAEQMTTVQPAHEVARRPPVQAGTQTGPVPAYAPDAARPDATLADPDAEPSLRKAETVHDQLTNPSGHARLELPGPESAADRARRKRQAGDTLGAQLAFYLRELSPMTKGAIIAVTIVVLGLVGLSLWQVFRPPPKRELPAEPQELTGTPVEHTFGLGDGVDYDHSDSKAFTFEVNAPTAAAVMLHYRAQDVQTDEVSVAVNGTEVGFVAADFGVPDRELETLLSQFLLKRGSGNAVVFDNVKNPPGKERWRVFDLWLELIPVPDVVPEQALGLAREALERGTAIEKLRTTGDDTLFRLWRTYRQGWISMLSLPDHARAALFLELKRRSDSVRAELDQQCGTIMLDAKKQFELKDPEKAREILEGVSRYFPTRDHPCPAIAEAKLREYDL